MLFRLLVSLIWLVPLSLAVNCYLGAVYNSTSSPTEQLSCPLITYCTKITALTPVSLATYGCDQSSTLCKTNGCYDNQNNGKTCCCSTNLCNGGGNYRILGSLLAASVSFLYLAL